jgi:hypothetical protein
LPPAKGKGCEEGSSSINGGKVHFTSKNFEVYKVFVRKLSFLILLGKLRVRAIGEMSIFGRQSRGRPSLIINESDRTRESSLLN